MWIDKIFAWAASVTTFANSNITTNLIFVKKKIKLCAILSLWTTATYFLPQSR